MVHGCQQAAKSDADSWVGGPEVASSLSHPLAMQTLDPQ